LESYLKKNYATQVVGHSLGALAAVFVAQQMQTLKIGALLSKPTFLYRSSAHTFSFLSAAPVSKVITFGMPNFMTEKTAAVYRSLCIVRVVDTHDPVDQLFIGSSFLNRQVTLLKQDYFCFQNLLPADESDATSSASGSSSSAASTATPPGSPKSARKGSDKSSKKDSEADSSSKKKDKGKSGEVKRPPPDLKSHMIDYYLKRLKPKIKGPVQNVDIKDVKEFS
jgi:hypothetical protein